MCGVDVVVVGTEPAGEVAAGRCADGAGRLLLRAELAGVQLPTIGDVWLGLLAERGA